MIGLLIFPILGALGVIFGAIAIGTNENTESWNKAVWKHENKALGMGRLALMWGIIDVIWLMFQYL